jgi:hypothetical protein
MFGAVWKRRLRRSATPASCPAGGQSSLPHSEAKRIQKAITGGGS